MTHLTYSERERAAYCAGHTRAADLLGALADAEAVADAQDLAIEAAREDGHTAGYAAGVDETDPDGAVEALGKVQDKLAAMGKLLQEVRATLDAKGALDRKGLANRIRAVQNAYGLYAIGQALPCGRHA